MNSREVRFGIVKFVSGDEMADKIALETGFEIAIKVTCSGDCETNWAELMLPLQEVS